MAPQPDVRPTPPALWTEAADWDGRPVFEAALPCHDQVPLYLVEFRPERADPAEALTPAEEVAGCRLRPGSRGPMRWREGHDSGSLRDVRAGHVLTWRVGPGDRVVLPLRVLLSGVRTFRYDPAAPEWGVHPYSTRWDRAEVEGLVRYGDSAVWGVRCLSTPGRSAALGEDMIEDAFGHDAVRLCLEDYLTREACDGRPGHRLCEVEFEAAPDGQWQGPGGEERRLAWWAGFEVVVTAAEAGAPRAEAGR